MKNMWRFFSLLVVLCAWQHSFTAEKGQVEPPAYCKAFQCTQAHSRYLSQLVQKRVGFAKEFNRYAAQHTIDQDLDMSGVVSYVLRPENGEVLRYALSQGLLKNSMFTLFKRAIWASNTPVVECVREQYDYVDASRNADLLFEAFTCPTHETMVPLVAGYMRQKNVPVDREKSFSALDLSKKTLFYHAFERGLTQEAQWLFLQGAVVPAHFFAFMSSQEALQRSTVIRAQDWQELREKELAQTVLESKNATPDRLPMIQFVLGSRRGELESACTASKNAQEELEKIIALQGFLKKACAQQQALED